MGGHSDILCYSFAVKIVLLSKMSRFMSIFTGLVTIFLFLSGFSLMNIHNSQDSRGGEATSLIPFYHFDPLNRRLDISWAITVGCLTLHIASIRT